MKTVQPSGKYDCIRIGNQICFPLYACAKEIVRRYKPFLDEIDLTYTQYITMMVLWEEKEISVGELGKKLYLDTGTLSPLLKSMEKKSLLTRSRDTVDERIVKIAITKEGDALREKAVRIPEKIGGCIKLSKDEAAFLYKILYSMLPS